MNPAIFVLVGAAIGLGLLYILLVRSAGKQLSSLKKSKSKKARAKKNR